MTGEHARVHNRIHKVLEDANIQLDRVLSDLLVESGRALLKADDARGSLRGQREELRLVRRGNVTEHPR